MPTVKIARRIAPCGRRKVSARWSFRHGGDDATQSREENEISADTFPKRKKSFYVKIQLSSVYIKVIL